MCTNTPISQPMMNMEVGFEKKVYFWPALLPNFMSDLVLFLLYKNIAFKI